MPIYEYRCDKCRRVFNFLVRDVSQHTTPRCPRCQNKGMVRLFSPCACHSSSRKGSGPGPGPDSEGEGLDAGTEGLAGDEELPELPGMEGLDENDPRSLGRWMRRMADEMGEPLDPEMEGVCRRLEAGEDPEKIDEEMGEAFGGGVSDYESDDTLYEA